MIWAQHTLLVREQFLEEPQGFASVAAPGGPLGDVEPGAQRVWVISAQHTLLVREQFLEEPQSFASVAAPGSPLGDVVPGAQRVWVISAQSTRSWSGSSSWKSRRASRASLVDSMPSGDWIWPGHRLQAVLRVSKKRSEMSRPFASHQDFSDGLEGEKSLLFRSLRRARI